MSYLGQLYQVSSLYIFRINLSCTMVEWPNKNQFDRSAKLIELDENTITLLKWETVSKYQVDMRKGTYISAIGNAADAMKSRGWV